MDISGFLGSYPGMFIVQSFVHSVIAATLVDSAITAWRIADPRIRQRMRFIVVLAPVLAFPLYQAVNPSRGEITFRLEALFDLGRWLNIALWGKVPLHVFFFFLLGATTLIFILQELIPIVRQTFEEKRTDDEWQPVGEDHDVVRTIEALPVDRPDIFIAENEDLILFSATGRKPAVYLSTGLVEALEPDEIRAAVAHEAAHIERSRRPVLVLAFVFRVLMFFNPAVLLEFRRIVQEEEKICDDFAVSLTGNPRVLAETLKKFRHFPGDSGQEKAPVDLDSLDQYGHDFLLDQRIERLEKGEAPGGGRGGWLQFAVTLGAILLVNYYIV